MTDCNVCKQTLKAPVYESPDNLSITTMNKIVPGRTQVYFCDCCSHIQTTELPNLGQYYFQEYEVNLASEDDDQVYTVINGKPIFRADHQATVLLSKLNIVPGSRILDYGCAKAPTLKKILSSHPDIEPYLFDVTDKYIPFWEKFPKKPHWAVVNIDPSWTGIFDVVLSFYALEHVADLHHALANIKTLLKTNGVFYFIVPNVYANLADFIVADHINHFSSESLRYLLTSEGFYDIEVDDSLHESAFVVCARLGESVDEYIPSNITNSQLAVTEMADYWQNIVGRLRGFEKNIPNDAIIAIYGAGFYGNFVFASLVNPERIRYVVDQNPHLQGSTVRDCKIIAPDQLPDEVTHILVGLNPRIAKASIEAIEVWQQKSLQFFFL
ncbi:hypothetical protein MTYM_00908 [Methylococcales bacterium]|nr:hypothetical protein MTYM_00908 [Methylococcales bacterium]